MACGPIRGNGWNGMRFVVTSMRKYSVTGREFLGNGMWVRVRRKGGNEKRKAVYNSFRQLVARKGDKKSLEGLLGRRYLNCLEMRNLAWKVWR